MFSIYENKLPFLSVEMLLSLHLKLKKENNKFIWLPQLIVVINNKNKFKVNIQMLKELNKKLEFKELNKKTEPKEFNRKVELKELNKKVESKELNKKVESKELDKKVESKELNKKVNRLKDLNLPNSHHLIKSLEDEDQYKAVFYPTSNKLKDFIGKVKIATESLLLVYSNCKFIVIHKTDIHQSNNFLDSFLSNENQQVFTLKGKFIETTRHIHIPQVHVVTNYLALFAWHENDCPSNPDLLLEDWKKEKSKILNVFTNELRTVNSNQLDTIEQVIFALNISFLFFNLFLSLTSHHFLF